MKKKENKKGASTNTAPEVKKDEQKEKTPQKPRMYGSSEKEPVPILPENVQNGEFDTSSPPSYEEVMGQYQSSMKQNQQELPPLSYIDILPKCLEVGAMENKIPPKFDSFSEVVKGANRWLEFNPGVRVWRCETVERKVGKGPIVSLDSTLLHESTYGFNVYIIGLRLWLTKKLDFIGPVQQLGVINVVPKAKEVPVNFRAGFYGGVANMGGAFIVGPGNGFGGGIGRAVVTSISTYEGLSKTLEGVNDNLKSSPVPGRILNVETSTFKFAEGFKIDKIDPEMTCWFEKGANTSKRYTQILRVFYIIGAPEQEQICMHEIKPEMTQASEVNKKSKFQPFPEVMNKTRMWLQSQTGIRILNLETRNARIKEFVDETQINSDSTDEFESTFTDKRYLRFIRIFYTPNTAVPSYVNTLLMSRLFYPMRTGTKTFEGMTETMQRIDSWLKITGLPVFDVETVHYLYQESNYIGFNPDKSDILVPQRVGKYWLTAIRVYFAGQYQEPPATMLPPYLDWKVRSVDGAQCCIIS